MPCPLHPQRTAPARRPHRRYSRPYPTLCQPRPACPIISPPHPLTGFSLPPPLPLPLHTLIALSPLLPSSPRPLIMAPCHSRAVCHPRENGDGNPSSLHPRARCTSSSQISNCRSAILPLSPALLSTLYPLAQHPRPLIPPGLLLTCSPLPRSAPLVLSVACSPAHLFTCSRAAPPPQTLLKTRQNHLDLPQNPRTFRQNAPTFSQKKSKKRKKSPKKRKSSAAHPSPPAHTDPENNPLHPIAVARPILALALPPPGPRNTPS